MDIAIFLHSHSDSRHFNSVALTRSICARVSARHVCALLDTHFIGSRESGQSHRRLAASTTQRIPMMQLEGGHLAVRHRLWLVQSVGRWALLSARISVAVYLYTVPGSAGVAAAR